jgi:hypothetical protein
MRSATGRDFSDALGTSQKSRGVQRSIVRAKPAATSECFPAVPVPTVRMRREVIEVALWQAERQKLFPTQPKPEAWRITPDELPPTGMTEAL